ncbi:MAG: acriflavin resistance protein [Sporomusa sp.]|nr:acriflavin resistance protein [Sporomusa sp.]
MKNFNLTEWALTHKQLVYFFMFLTFVMGAISYQSLGRMEDPDFVIRQMIVGVSWPGANARQVEEQVTDKIEKKLQDTPNLYYLKSYSKAGEAIIYIYLQEATPEKDVRQTWLEVRNMVNDIKPTLPEGIAGFYFNDRFDDVFGNIYAITGDGYSYEELRKTAERIRRILLGVENVKKVDLLGVQPEKIYIEMENSKLAQLGMDPSIIINTIKAQNAISPSGMVETASDNIYLRVTGIFADIESIRSLPIRANGRTFRLGDIASVERGYAEPREPQMFYNGQPAIGIALSMEKGGNILNLGKNLHQAVKEIRQELPLGLEINQVLDQPQVVSDSVGQFTETLGLAILIVLAISFLSLGFRSGIVVALCIPLVIAGIFTGMKLAGVDLHKVSLGALIISLGLLVDDAIIAVEMIIVKLEQGWNRFDAACYAYTATAFPMLTGTLITCAGFIPVGFSKSIASEYTNSIFTVVTIALLISWVVAVIVTPLLGYKLVNVAAGGHGHSAYDTTFYRLFRQLLSWCLNHRKIVLGITLACFIGSLFLFTLIRQDFFPPSTRPELIVEMTLPEGASFQAVEQEAAKLAATLNDDPNIVNYTYYIGQGGPRFVLTIEPVLPTKNYAQFVIVTKDAAARIALQQKLDTLVSRQFENVLVHMKTIQTGPPQPYPVMLRVTGYEHAKVREIAEKIRSAMADTPGLRDVNLNWNEKSKVMHLQVDQERARMLGVDSLQLATSLQSQVSGIPVGEFREKDQKISMLFRIDAKSRQDLSSIKDLNIHTGNGKYIPLDQIAQIRYDAEDGLIWRRNLKPTITVQAEVKPEITGNDATKQVYDKLLELRNSLPPGYAISVDGPLEDSFRSVGSLLKLVPVVMLIMMILLMIQLQSVSRMTLTLLTAPLGVIGVSLSLLITQQPVGFVAVLGILALAGIIIRNSVILIDQIEQQILLGESPWDAVINATILRFRPIMLTAVAAILGMIPLFSSIFWGPMAIAIAGGLLIATILTLLVLPTMYVTWFRIGSKTSYTPTISG